MLANSCKSKICSLPCPKSLQDDEWWPLQSESGCESCPARVGAERGERPRGTQKGYCEAVGKEELWLLPQYSSKSPSMNLALLRGHPRHLIHSFSSLAPAFMSGSSLKIRNLCSF